LNIIVKDTVRIKRILPQFFIVCLHVSSVYKKRNLECVLTSANDSTHMQNSYHYEDLAWDFRIQNRNLTFSLYEEILDGLRSVSPYFDVVPESHPGNEHIHIEYDSRRKIREQGEDIFSVYDLNIKKNYEEGKKMAVNWKKVISFALFFLKPALKLVSKFLRDEIEKAVQSWYRKALETENPWDDFFVEQLAQVLDIELEKEE